MSKAFKQTWGRRPGRSCPGISPAVPPRQSPRALGALGHLMAPHPETRARPFTPWGRCARPTDLMPSTSLGNWETSRMRFPLLSFCWWQTGQAALGWLLCDTLVVTGLSERPSPGVSTDRSGFPRRAFVLSCPFLFSTGGGGFLPPSLQNSRAPALSASVSRALAPAEARRAPGTVSPCVSTQGPRTSTRAPVQVRSDPGPQDTRNAPHQLLRSVTPSFLFEVVTLLLNFY